LCCLLPILHVISHPSQGVARREGTGAAGNERGSFCHPGLLLAPFAIGALLSRRMLSGRRGDRRLGGAGYAELAGGLVEPFGYAGAILLAALFFTRASWVRGLTTFADLFRRYLLGGRRAAGGPHAAAWIHHWGGGSGAGLWAGHAPQFQDGLGIGHHACGGAGGGLLGGLLANAVTDVVEGVCRGGWAAHPRQGFAAGCV